MNCRTKKQARIFFEEMFQHHPEFMTGWNSRGYINSWDLYKSETCYWPSLYRGPGLEYCDIDFFIRANSYKIVDFEEVVFEVSDFGEIQQAEEMTTNLLYEIGV